MKLRTYILLIAGLLVIHSMDADKPKSLAKKAHQESDGEKKMRHLQELVEKLGGLEVIDSYSKPEEFAGICQQINECGIHANARDAYGFTALMYAVFSNSYVLTTILLKAKDVDVLAQDEDGNTALTYAYKVKANLAQQPESEPAFRSIDVNEMIIKDLEKASLEQRLRNAQIEEDMSKLSNQKMQQPGPQGEIKK